MPLAIFDIDGTLTDTVAVDLECYEAAVLEEWGVQIPTEWPSFVEVTDSAILATACARAGRPVPDPQTERRIAVNVGARLEAELQRSPGRFRPIPGAPAIFEVLRQSGWTVAMATGAWRPSALVKLGGAGIPHAGVPLATSTEHPARRDIIARAVSVAVEAAALEDSGPVVYFGDGVWDGRAAASLGCTFIGVGLDRAEALRAAGARVVIPDFGDSASVLAHLDAVA